MKYFNTIEIEWFEEREEFQEALFEHGFERAHEMIEQGYLEGELNTVLTDPKTGEEVECWGWWKTHKEHTICLNMREGAISIEKPVPEHIHVILRDYDIGVSCTPCDDIYTDEDVREYELKVLS